jgi:2-polyprenyl-3-methyl-5-hydroxy-6-metoxy-1,4-benzoquinol methylase
MMSLENSYNLKPKEYFGEERKEILPYIPKNVQKILDIGCSAGEFGSNLKKEFKNVCVWGVEPNQYAADLAKSKLDMVICSLFNEHIIGLEEQTFDCITFNDVLEHLIEPSSALKQCAPLLNKGASIVASIPNVMFFPVMYNLIKNEDWKYEDSGVLDSTHLKFFTKKSIIRLFEECGYEITTIEGINIKIHDKYRMYKILNFLLFNKLKYWKYMQFIIVARKK